MSPVLVLFRLKARRQVRKHRGQSGLVVVPIYPMRWFWLILTSAWTSIRVSVDTASTAAVIISAYPVSEWVPAKEGTARVRISSDRTRDVLGVYEVAVSGGRVLIYIKPEQRLLWALRPARVVVEYLHSVPAAQRS